MNFDEALEKTGSMGKAQLVLIFITNCLFALTGWQQMVTVFAARDVDFYCHDKFINITASSESLESSVFDNQCVDSCSKYIYRSGISSIMKEFQLDCGHKRILKPFVHSAYWLGFGVSTLYGGYLGDKFGRKTTAMIANVIYIVASVVTMFSPNIESLLAFRVITGLCQGAFFPLVYLIMVECVTKKHIATVEYIAQVFYALGEMIAVTIGYVLIFSWQFQVMCIAIALLLFFVICLLVLPESPRWLYSEQRYEDSKKVLNWFGKLNNKDTTSIIFDEDDRRLLSSNNPPGSDIETDPLQNQPKSTTHPNILGLFKTLPAFFVTMTQVISWVSIGFIYSGLFYDAKNIGSDFYVSSILLAASEMPVVFLCLFINKHGRKMPLIWCLVISTVSCAVLPFTGSVAGGKLQISIAVVSKLAATGGISITFIYTPETFPTILRSSGLNICLCAQEMAIFMAPFLLQYTFGPYNCSTFLIFAASGALATLTVIFFGKETLGVPLFDTVRQYQEFARS